MAIDSQFSLRHREVLGFAEFTFHHETLDQADERIPWLHMSGSTAPHCAAPCERISQRHLQPAVTPDVQ